MLMDMLFPGGSMSAVLPVYERSAGALFFNGRIVAAVEAVLNEIGQTTRVVALEVGAGTGGTTSSVLPVLTRVCERYINTDVSDSVITHSFKEETS